MLLPYTDMYSSLGGQSLSYLFGRGLNVTIIDVTIVDVSCQPLHGRDGGFARQIKSPEGETSSNFSLPGKLLL